MSTVIATKSNNTGTAGDVTITKPTSLAVGDILLAFIHSQTSGANSETHTGPSGWTRLVNIVPSNGSVLTVWGVLATSTQTAATNFSWTSGGDNSNTIGAVYRITSTNGFTSISANVVSAGAQSTDYPTPSYTGVTTIADDSLLIVGFGSKTISGIDVDFSAYAVANNNPTWTEQDDLGNGGGARANLGVASATFVTAGATGNFSVTLSADGGDCSGAIVAITENVNAAGTVAFVTSTQTVFGAPTGSAGTTASNVFVASTQSAFSPASSRASSPTQWENEPTVETSWTNETL